MSPRNSKGIVAGVGGFTLIEVILALVLAGAVFGIVYGGILFSYKARDKGEARMDESQHIRSLIDRIVPVIHSAYPLIHGKDDERKLFFLGKDDTLGLVTSDVETHRDDLANRPGLRWVLFMRDSEGLKMVEDYFFNPDAPEEENDGTEILLDPSVTDIRFEYLQIKPDETQGDWVDEWDPEAIDEDVNKQQLPRAVRITMRIKDGEKEKKIPPFVVRIYAYTPP